MASTSNPQATDEKVLDVRPIPPRSKHPTIFSTIAPKHRFDQIMHAYRTLPPGAVLELVVDHEPQCMYYTLLANHGADAFAFDYLERGPETWRVHVTRTLPE